MKSRNEIHPSTGFAIALLALLALLLNGCGGSGLSTGSSSGSPVILTGIAITPSSETLTTGTTARLTATGSYSNATTADISTSVTWLSAASGTASVSSAGVVTGNAAGTTTITASASGGTPSASDTITVTDATLNGITVAPLTMLVAKGTTTTFTATGTFSDNSTGNISGAVSWTSSDPAIATINASGIATGVNAGSCTITASSGGVSNTATLTVF